jgi:hypothetical protein
VLRDPAVADPLDPHLTDVASAPEWIGRVPQKDLAAYPGVTPMGLNRIIRRPAAGATRPAPERSARVPGSP